MFFNFTFNLKVLSFNCHGVKSSSNTLQQFTKDVDILMIQEHWLYPDELTYMSFLSENFCSFSISPMTTDDKLLRGRPHGGVSILWRKSLSHIVKTIKYDDDRIIGIEMKTSTHTLLFLCCYLPHECDMFYDDYCFYLDKFKCIIESANTPYIFILGDFNADILSQSIFGSELIEFCDMNNLSFIDKSMLSPDTFTFISQAHGTTSWLDHCITTTAGESLIAFYGHIISSIQLATSKCIPSSNNDSKFKIIPGWNDYVKESYAISRDALKWWISNNRPRFGIIYHDMRTTRAQFKYALRITKRNEDCARADALARDLYDKDVDEFWSSVRQLNRSSSLLSNCIEGVTGEKTISDYWREHFHKLLNCNSNDTDLKYNFIGKLENIQYDANMIVTSEDICKLIEKLKCGKASGPDGISAESLRFAHDSLHVLLSLCFSACLSHSFLPQSLLETTIVPVIKNKCGSLTDSNNYRPIAIATITSKLLESVISMKCEEYLFTSDNQFGFKAQHSTEFCIYSLLEFIDYYKKRNTTVFVTFLDASKAFDRVNYWMLFSKLIDKNVPLYIVKLLVFWYTKQEMKVRLGNTISSSFKVGNGVKQGGILSPVLFNIYMDKLSIALNDTAIGGKIGGQLLNHLCYADDMCLISISSSGMQQLLNVCHSFSIEHSLLYNGTKSYSLCFKPNSIKFERPGFYLGELLLPKVTQCKYLGVIISDHNCDLDLKRQMKKFYTNANMLIRKFFKCTVDVKCYLFKTYCSTLYCSAMWFDSTKSAMKKLKVAYNNSLRRLLSLPTYNSASEMFAVLNIPSFGELLRKFAFSLMTRIASSINSFMVNIYSSSVPMFSKIWGWWYSILTI